VAANTDPRKEATAREVASRHRPDPSAPNGADRVMRSGQAELLGDGPARLREDAARSVEDEPFLRALGMRSAVIAPIVVGTHVLGAITMGHAESGRSFTKDDVAFAEDVGRRAGTAIENAELFATAQKARDQAQQASGSKDAFLAAVSHELRTPLNAILGWGSMLESSALDETKRGRAVETVMRNAAAMQTLVEDLLDVSRITSGRIKLDIGQVDMVPVVEAAFDAIKPAAEAKEVRVRRVLDPDAGAVLGDSTRLQQIVWNLLANAVKFTSKGGRVNGVLRRADSSVELVVTDNGRGIHPDFLPHVFEPFQQENAGTKRYSGGLGLGLAISKNLVELHGGTLEAHSPGEGQGSTFVVRLPLATLRAVPPPRDGPYQPPPTPSADLEGLLVLVVDDNPDALVLLQTLLEESRARVVVAQSVEAAMDAIAREVPHVLLSDVGMPNEDGFDLIRRVRALPAGRGRDLPAAALTAYARIEDRRKVLNAGYMMHVPKPVDPAELATVVQALARLSPLRRG
jgi:signal transduction histidine kinase/CheY-like chemotaxis protein